jgi:hypothetical protein
MYDQNDTLQGRRLTEIPIREAETSLSKQAYFDKARPILIDRARAYMMELDQPLAGAVTTARDQPATMGIYLEKMRERNSSLQERLNLSLKSSSRLDSGSFVKRPGTAI